jgi:hypothetical protein
MMNIYEESAINFWICRARGRAALGGARARNLIFFVYGIFFTINPVIFGKDLSAKVYVIC